MISEQHRQLLEWYESLNDEEREALDYWLDTGDSTLISRLRCFSSRLEKFVYRPFVESAEELILLG